MKMRVAVSLAALAMTLSACGFPADETVYTDIRDVMELNPEIKFGGIKFTNIQYRMHHWMDYTSEWVSLKLDKENLDKFLNANADETKRDLEQNPKDQVMKALICGGDENDSDPVICFDKGIKLEQSAKYYNSWTETQYHVEYGVQKTGNLYVVKLFKHS